MCAYLSLETDQGGGSRTLHPYTSLRGNRPINERIFCVLATDDYKRAPTVDGRSAVP